MGRNYRDTTILLLMYRSSKTKKCTGLIFESECEPSYVARPLSRLNKEKIAKKLDADDLAIIEKIKLLHQTRKLDFETVKTNLRNFKTLQLNQKRNILGEFLYPKVENKVGRQFAPKITGMLIDLEVMNEEEILEMIEDESTLEERIEEAKEVMWEEDY
eukprot:TRINITY_DN1159_c0_g1_i5.p1 TRINITY_DN1159_c0_g1~~TRINITY_DN1159_c0_g1_i5.p1  ORF type:complete len:159 (+),score=39.09 TRINITY_DN1159_c0_g1_i5:93-569(+)